MPETYFGFNNRVIHLVIYYCNGSASHAANLEVTLYKTISYFYQIKSNELMVYKEAKYFLRHHSLEELIENIIFKFQYIL